MAKYIIVLSVLAVMAFENSGIQKRIYVESLPNVRAESSDQRQKQQMHLNNNLYAANHIQHNRHHHQRQQLHQPPQQQHHHQRHKRIHHTNNARIDQNRNHQEREAARKIVKRQSVADVNTIANDELLAAHIRRHQEHQLEHLQHHNRHYQHQAPTILNTITSTETSEENLKSMPRPWQHLLQPNDKMYGDAPFSDEGIAQTDYDEAKTAFRNIFMNSENSADEQLPTITADEGFIDSASIEESFEHNDSNNLEIDESNEEIQPENDVITKPKKKDSSHSTPTHRCPKCAVQRQVEHITPEELTRLRIEFVKNQILEKLRLKERPKVSAVALPKPIQEGVTIDQGDGNAKNKELDDYYARTSKKFIFLERETRNCNRTNVQKSICFSFKIDEADADGFDVNTAALWIFKKSLRSKKKISSTTQTKHNNTHINNNNNNTLINHEDIVVYEVQPPDDQEFQPVSKTIAIKRIDKNVSDKWLEIHIEWPIQRWFGNHDLSHLIQISCESCDINDIEDMISIDKDYRPFIMIDTQNRRRASRQKRSINCTDGVTECCREKLYISFDEIGWGDWIVQPRGYDAYFCRGSCGTVASVTQSQSHHSSILQKVIAMKRDNGNPALELIPCCTAKQYSSLQLVFMDSNNTATQKTFPNMVIESCGCR